MPSWDDPTVKWDDPLVGFNGGTPVTRVPTWSDSLSTWGDPGEGWNGESQSGDVQYGAPPGLYVKEPRGLQNVLQATIVTTGCPGQPAGDQNMFLKIVMPYPAGYDMDYVEYDLDVYSPVPLVTTAPTGYGHMWTSLGLGDDGQTWAGTPAWFTTVGGSVYKRSGQTIWRILGSPERSYAMRCRLWDGPWVDAFHIGGVPTTLQTPLPTGMYQVYPSQPWTNAGPVAKNPGGTTKDALVVAQLGQTVWRRAGYAQPTLTTTGGYGDVSYFRVRSDPAGAQVYGYVKWQDGTNYVLSRWGPVPDNTAVYTNMNTIIDMLGSGWVGLLVSQIGAPWDTVWPMGAAGGRNFTLDSYTLVGAGTPTDPYQSSAQHHLLYQT